jgi:hypothetical protein
MKYRGASFSRQRFELLSAFHLEISTLARGPGAKLSFAPGSAGNAGWNDCVIYKKYLQRIGFTEQAGRIERSSGNKAAR